MRLGTRGSALALTQAEWVAQRLADDVEIVPITTLGDGGTMLQDKSRWVSELERALLDGRIDIAVHSAKDVPTELPPGLELVAIPDPRRRPRRALWRPAARRPVPRRAGRDQQHPPRRPAPRAALRPRGGGAAGQCRYAAAQARRRRSRCAGARPGRPDPARSRGRSGRDPRRSRAGRGPGRTRPRGPDGGDRHRGARLGQRSDRGGMRERRARASSTPSAPPATPRWVPTPARGPTDASS